MLLYNDGHYVIKTVHFYFTYHHHIIVKHGFTMTFSTPSPVMAQLLNDL